MSFDKLSNPPILVAFHGFSNKGEQERLTHLFVNAQYWQQPWKIVDELHRAEFLLVAANHPDDLAMWHDQRFNKKNLIVYSKHRFNHDYWHLPHLPSTTEFASLLKSISQERNSRYLPKISSKPVFAREVIKRRELKILIIGSIGSGKTSSVNLLTNNSLTTEVMPSDHTRLYKKSTTVAMDYGTLTIDSKRLHIYGAPGQRRFDFMSDILLKNAKGLIILISNKDSKPLNELNYYLNNYESFLQRHPAVIGVTHNDINPNPSLQEYLEFMQRRSKPCPVIKIDARKQSDLLKLVSLLLAQMAIAV